MKIIIIYFYLFTFWLTNTIGFSLTGVKGLSLTNLSFYLLFLVWAFNIVFKKKLLGWNSVNNYIIVIIFVVLLSIPYNVLRNETSNLVLKQNIIWFKKWIEPFIIYFIMLGVIDDRNTCKRTIFGLGIFLFIAALSGPLTFFNIINLGRVSNFGRASAFGDTNQFASFLVLFIPLILTFALFHKSNTFRACGAVALFATFFALIFSGSRGGILSFAASMFSYLIILYSQKIIRLRALFSVTVIVLMVSTISFALAPSRVKKLVSHRLDPTQSESVEQFSSGRLKIWRQSISLFTEKPIFGHGLQSIVKSMESQFGKGAVAHNQYLNYLVEFGIIGCALFILIILKLFQVMWDYQKITPDLWEKKLFIGYIAGLLGYASSMLFVNVSNFREIFWIYTVVLLRYGQLQENDHKLLVRNK